MAKKYIVVAVIVGITLGSLGTYFSNYALNLFGIDEISIPSLDEQKQIGVQMQSIPKSIFTNELQYNLVEVKKTDFGINGEKPLEGGVFLITKIEIENFGKQEVIVYGENWFLKDQDDRVYTPKTFNATPEKNENIFSIRIPPGFKITQNIGFEIPSKLESQKELYVADRAFESEPIFLGIV
ncbi:MAG: DUF4352 domain-containing protein [Nitrosopumilus sp.]|nr:DUF4352 domain-containing protein [Nitrosopumilus sp.]MDH3824888.1 DUF4352 domain-containing protein [Nitrosopumilus sp.]